MKIVLSKKGFDSQYGKKPSIILPESNQMISFPIPADDEDDELFSSEIRIHGRTLDSYFDDLGIPKGRKHHLDPVIQDHGYELPYGAFGQSGSAMGHLRNQGVKCGDVFLFYGTFSHARLESGRLQYEPMYPFHCIWGYLEVCDIVDDIEGIPRGKYSWLTYHPHYKNRNGKEYKKANSIFIGKKYGAFTYRDELRLTKLGYNKTYWSLPSCFEGVDMSYNEGKTAKKVGDRVEIYVPGKAQEFVFDVSPGIRKWLNNITGL
jgi:hypothetical protein